MSRNPQCRRNLVDRQSAQEHLGDLPLPGRKLVQLDDHGSEFGRTGRLEDDRGALFTTVRVAQLSGADEQPAPGLETDSRLRLDGPGPGAGRDHARPSGGVVNDRGQFEAGPLVGADLRQPATYQRLRDAKASYDPGDLFLSNHPITPGKAVV